MKLKIIKRKKKKQTVEENVPSAQRLKRIKKNLPTKVRNNYYYLTLSLIYKKKKTKNLSIIYDL